MALMAGVFVVGTSGLSAAVAHAAPAKATPGTLPHTALAAPAVPTGGINPVVTETGKITVSTDGLGTTNAAGGSIQAQKPAGATVRGAYLAAATVPLAATLANGDVTLAGTAVNFSTIIPSAINGSNGFANVTSIVKPIIDGAPAGIVNLHIDEARTFDIDGETLAVIFDDPSQTASNTVVLLFGTEQTTGDSFHIGLGSPVNKADPHLRMDMGLGISFGFQPSGQFSQIDVNGSRLTTSAGGQDDCPAVEQPCQDGSLLTMGGIGDTNANPPNPTADDTTCGPPAAPFCDDELYNLLPFVKTGDTSIDVNTLNPSNDDNIFFGAFTLNSTTAVVGEGVTLSPASATNQLGQPHTLTATVFDDNGNPVSGKTVTFTVTAGPNHGKTGTGVTNGSGKATFTYTSSLVGTDTIQASFKNSAGVTVTSNSVTKTWTTGGNSPTTCVVTALRAGPPQQQDVTVKDADGIASIFNVNVLNGSVAVPAFTSGTHGPVVLTATKADQTKRTFWEFDVTDSKGVTTHCV